MQPLKESRKVMAAAEYCMRAAAFFRSNATCTLSKATLSEKRDSLANCCCRTRLDAEFMGKKTTNHRRGYVMLYLALSSAQQSEDRDQGV